MKTNRLIAGILLLCLLLLASCTQNTGPTVQSSTDSAEQAEVETVAQSGAIPEALAVIPNEYKTAAEHPGTLETLEYITWESMTYASQSKQLTKTAIVYLPYGYSESTKYNVFYLMHGGWSNEETWLGTPEQPSEFKNAIDHAMASGEMRPLIIVCPTYNNESREDSADYSLALRLTDNYHNELANNLIPAVEGKYSTFASDTTAEALKATRDHRGFGGFSMGSVATWHTFKYGLDYFRYFMPMSGALTSDGAYMANIVEDTEWDWNDFFIYAMSGTDDFAYSAFRAQIEAMAADQSDLFREADNERDGNLAFRVQEGGVHDGEYASQYAYNGLCWFWNSSDSNQNNTASSNDTLTAGSTEYRGFTVDNVLHSEQQGDIHFNILVPDSYDGTEPYALYVTLPGYQGLYFQGVAENLKTETFGFEAQSYNNKMIIAAPQLSDWGKTSADQTIVLVESLIGSYNIDTDKVYISGYSGGGETLSLVLDEKPELFTAALMCSSQWDGGYERLIQSRTPVYFVIGESDEYYGAKPFTEAYQALHKAYEQQGLSNAEIDELLVLDVKSGSYFSSQGVTGNQHGYGSALFAADAIIMGWLFSHNDNGRF